MTQSTEQLAVLDRAEPAALVPTPNRCDLPRRLADFPTFVDALDYAARGGPQLPRSARQSDAALSFSELRADAVEVAYRLIARGMKGDRIAMVAETGADFAALFCGAIYAGAWPVPLPLPTSFGGKDNYIDQLGAAAQSIRRCSSIRPKSPPWAMPPPPRITMPMAPAGLSWDVLCSRGRVTLPEARGEDICYLQYSSGSTRFPMAWP
jgi:fatty-acyl-CoA synthase